MNQTNHNAEIEIVRIISNLKDEKLLAQVDKEWFDNHYCKSAIEIWNNINTFDYMIFNQSAKDGMYNIPELEIKFLYEQPNVHSEFDSAIAVVKNKYRQRKLEEKIKEVQKRIYSLDPAEIEMDLIEYFKNQESEHIFHRKITSGFAQENKGLLTIGGTIRPKFDDIMPLRKSVITIAADSGHHKSNQAIDILMLALHSNPGKKVVFFSKEMEFDEVQARIYAKCLNIPLRSILRRKDSKGIRLDVSEWTKRMNDEFPNIVDNFIIIPPQEFKKNSDIGKILITYEPIVWALDFLQYYAQEQAGNAAEQNRNVMEAAAFTKNISQITNSFGVLLSQVRKKSESRISVFPRIDDMEWSGLTKQISHTVGMAFWPYKHNNKCFKDYYCLSYQKVRNGDLFVEEIEVDPETTRFKYPYPTSKKTLQDQALIKSYYKM